jgi:hypothetical protein
VAAGPQMASYDAGQAGVVFDEKHSCGHVTHGRYGIWPS